MNGYIFLKHFSVQTVSDQILKSYIDHHSLQNTLAAIEQTSVHSYLCMSVGSLIAVFVPKCFPAVLQPLQGWEKRRG